MVNEYIKKINRAIQIADVGVSKEYSLAYGYKLHQEIFHIMSSSPHIGTKEQRIFLNELIQPSDKYLHIGTYIGSMFVSALYNNNATGVAIDQNDFPNDKIKFDNNCEKFNIKNYTYIKNNPFELTDDEKLIVQNSNIYFYDGNNSEENLKKSITYYYDLLADPFIYIQVRDRTILNTNYTSTKATREALNMVNAKIQKEWYLDAKNELGEDVSKGARSWKDSLFIAIIAK